MQRFAVGHRVADRRVRREVLGAHSIKVYAMPRMRDFLQHNGPWDQLVKLQNVAFVMKGGEVFKIKTTP